jgi:hypothetical protein
MYYDYVQSMLNAKDPITLVTRSKLLSRHPKDEREELVPRSDINRESVSTTSVKGSGFMSDKAVPIDKNVDVWQTRLMGFKFEESQDLS